MWPCSLGAAALLLASAAMVVAIRRPGPVRNTLIKMFPARARSRYSSTAQQAYGDDYGGSGSHGSSGYMSDAARTDAYAAKSAPSALRADPTDVIPAHTGGGARGLCRSAGGQPVTLDPARLAGGGLTFGRDADCDIVSDHNTVSKKHARITRSGTANSRSKILAPPMGLGVGAPHSA